MLVISPFSQALSLVSSPEVVQERLKGGLRKMGEPESWEEMEAPSKHANSHAKTIFKLNANAPAFSFNANAASFVPGQSIKPAVPPAPYVPAAVSEPRVEPPATVHQPEFESGSSSSNPQIETDQRPKEQIEDVATEPVDGSVKESAAANGQTPAYEDQVVSNLKSLTVKDSECLKSLTVKDSERQVGGEQECITREDIQEPEEDEIDKKRHLNAVFIGHVDAGKSTIGGQILFLTNMVDERTIQKYEREAKDKNRESWYMAYIMDTNEEERTKGITVEVGRAHFETEKTRFTILDAPGHKNYVPNMISGASQADVGVLVISARKGEFETGFERGGQTREHAQLAKTLGVSKLLVVVNKMDDASVQWSKDRFEEIEKKMIPFLKTCGYNAKKDVQFLPISGLYGTNMKVRMPKSVCGWWNGPCLFEALDSVEIPVRDPKGPFRMPIVDKFRDMGTVVMGKVESGSIRQGDNLVLMPNKAHVKVIAIYRDDNEVKWARPGENLRVKLSGVEEENVSAGFVLCSALNPIPSVLEFDAQLQILELLDHKAIFTAGYKAILHIHSIVEECEIIELLQQIDPKTKKPMKKKVLFVKSGAVVVCRIQVNDYICVEKFSDFSQLGRFTLRDEGKTVAIGKVVNFRRVAGQE